MYTAHLISAWSSNEWAECIASVTSQIAEMKLNDENKDRINRIADLLREDDDLNALFSSDTSNGTSSQSNGNSTNDEIIFSILML